MTYPFKPYPPFKDPDDWRELSPSSEASTSIKTKAEALCADATADHSSKHERHDHPWCIPCSIRLQEAWDGFEQGRIVNAAEAWRRLTERAEQTITRQHLDAAMQWLAYETPIPQDGLSEATVEALAEWALDRDREQSAVTQAQFATRSRACRYLILHGRQPVDTFDPDRVESRIVDELLNGDELDELPAPEPLIEKIIDRHTYAILRGRDGTLKSFTALDWALCLATGKPWQGFSVPKRVRVLYIAGEGAYGLQARKAAWEDAWGRTVHPATFTVLPRGTNLHAGDELDDLLDVIREEAFALVIIDTLRRVSGKADGNGSEMGTVVDNIEKIKRATANGSVLVITHTDKNDNDSRGFSGIEDDADIVWHAKRLFVPGGGVIGSVRRR